MHMVKIAKSKTKYKHAREDAQHSADETKIKTTTTHIQNIKHPFPFTCSEESTRPSSTKSGYIISHSDLLKSALESEPPHDVGAARARSASIFIFFDLPREALLSVVFHH
jgi:hypothetical protein